MTMLEEKVLWALLNHVPAMHVKDNLRAIGPRGLTPEGQSLLSIFALTLRYHANTPLPLIRDYIALYLEMGADPCFVLQQPELGIPPLYIASYIGDWKSVMMLLGAGARVNQREFEGNRATPLIVAACQGHLDIVKTLVKHQANPLLREAQGRTAKDMAHLHGYRRIVTYLDNVERRYIRKLRHL